MSINRARSSCDRGQLRNRRSGLPSAAPSCSPLQRSVSGVPTFLTPQGGASMRLAAGLLLAFLLGAQAAAAPGRWGVAPARHSTHGHHQPREGWTAVPWLDSTCQACYCLACTARRGWLDVLSSPSTACCYRRARSLPALRLQPAPAQTAAARG